MDNWVERAQSEVSNKAWHRTGKDRYGALAVLVLQLRSHAMDFPENLKVFEDAENAIDSRYSGNPINRSYVLYAPEAAERLKNALKLAHDIGPLMIDSKYADSIPLSPDEVDLTGFEGYEKKT